MKKVVVLLSVVFSIAVLAGCSFILCHSCHEYGDWIVTTKETCAENGEMTRKCKACGHIETSVRAALGHNYADETITVEPTCTEDGSKTSTCKNCGDIKVESIPSAHTWNGGIVTTKATCKATGVKTYTCTVCSDTKIEEIPVLSHSEYKIKCPYCGDWLVTQSFVGIAAKDGDGLDVTVTKWTKTVGENYDTYYLSYTIENNVADSKYLPGTFDIIMEDGTKESQSGFFNYIYTGESSTRSYSWKILHTQKPFVLEYSKSFGSNSVTLYWDVPQD